MPSFGEKLKQEREKRKITLEQISSSTKIGTRMLQALEEDKFNQLPGGIFNKGFVRAYSRFVGLDEDQTVAEYLQASGDAPPARTELGREDGVHDIHREGHPEKDHRENDRENNEENISRLEAGTNAPSRPLPWGLFAAVLLLIALALSLWSHRQRGRSRQPVSPTSTTSASPSSSGVSDTDGGSALATASPPLTATPTAHPASSAALKTPQSSAKAAPAATPGEFVVLIQTREESWISITADGKSVASELMPAGSERSIRGQKEVIVRAGNSGAVDFHLNGKKIEVGGDFGEVKTVTFGPQGILPNAPGPPETP